MVSITIPMSAHAAISLSEGEGDSAGTFGSPSEMKMARCRSRSDEVPTRFVMHSRAPM